MPFVWPNSTIWSSEVWSHGNRRTVFFNEKIPPLKIYLRSWGSQDPQNLDVVVFFQTKIHQECTFGIFSIANYPHPPVWKTKTLKIIQICWSWLPLVRPNKTWPPVLARHPPSCDCNNPSLVHLARMYHTMKKVMCFRYFAYVHCRSKKNFRFQATRSTSRRQICCTYPLCRPPKRIFVSSAPYIWSPYWWPSVDWTSLCFSEKNDWIFI